MVLGLHHEVILVMVEDQVEVLLVDTVMLDLGELVHLVKDMLVVTLTHHIKQVLVAVVLVLMVLMQVNNLVQVVLVSHLILQEVQ